MPCIRQVWRHRKNWSIITRVEGNHTKLKTSHHGFEILLATVMMARGTSFIFSKQLLETLEPFNVLAVRFGMAFLVLAAIFFKVLGRATRKSWIAGALVGTMYFIVMALEMIALTLADTGPVALVEHTAIVIVPIAVAVLSRRLPSRTIMLSAFLAVVGVGLLTVPGGELSVGLLLALGGAFCYAATIIITDRFTDTPEAGLAIGIIQLGSLALLATVACVIWETPHLPATQSQWGMMAMLVFVCTIFGFALQPVTQARVSPEITGLMAALNPAVAAVLGALVLHEVFGWLGLLGIGLILLAIVLPTLPPGSPRGSVNGKLKSQAQSQAQ